MQRTQKLSTTKHKQLARHVRYIQRSWRIDGRVFRNMLGVTAVEWQYMKRGGSLPLRTDVLLNAREILRINSALTAILKGNESLIPKWLHSPNSGIPHNGLTIVSVMRLGLVGLHEVRIYLEYHAYGGW